MHVADGDALGWAALTGGADEVLLVTAAGQAIRFKEEEVRPMGLSAGGVMGVKLASEADGVVVMAVVQPDGYLWSITNAGLAKATPLAEYPTQGRHGQGVINVRLGGESSEVVTAVIGDENTQIIVNTATGSTKKLKLKETYTGSRSIKPREIVTVGARNRVTGAVKFVGRPDFQIEDEETAVAQQLSLINDETQTTRRKRKARA
jgi:DNA gyrase subunit A